MQCIIKQQQNRESNATLAQSVIEDRSDVSTDVRHATVSSFDSRKSRVDHRYMSGWMYCEDARLIDERIKRVGDRTKSEDHHD